MALSIPGDHRLFCLQGASRSFEFAYREELESIAKEVPWFEYVPTVSRPWHESEWTGETGRVDDVIRKYADLWDLKPEATTVYLCGHSSIVDHGRCILHRAGWKREAILDEIYSVQEKATSKKLSIPDVTLTVITKFYRAVLSCSLQVLPDVIRNLQTGCEQTLGFDFM